MVRKLLIVEDDAAFGTMLQSWSKRNGFDTQLCANMLDAQKALSGTSFELILSDLRLPDGDGIMLLGWLRENKMEAPVIIMTSYAEIQSAVSAIKLGASDFLEKPIVPTILKQKIDLALQNTAQGSTVQPKPEQHGFIAGCTPVALKMYEHIKLVAPTQMTVLINGESGTGKEYVARLIHETSKRNRAPFLAVDCGSLSKELAPSELFGHLKGSFTSAISDKTGVFEQAKGGTVFLDEIGNLSYDVQIQLLRALQEQKVRPVGSASDVKIDVRIVAATNESLENAIAQGRFREDLFHRINEFSIQVPPLRERKGDIVVFAAHFLEQANAELGKQVKGFMPETLLILENQYWSGNLRELRNVIRRAALFASGEVVTPDNLPLLHSRPKPEPESLSLRPANEKEQIEAALKEARGNKVLAARLLQIDRKTLYNKMHLYGIRL